MSPKNRLCHQPPRKVKDMLRVTFPIKQQQKATLKNFCFRLRNAKCLLVSDRICPLPAQIDQRSAADTRSPLVLFAPLWGEGPVMGKCGVLQGGGDMGSTELSFPDLGWKFAFQGVPSGDGDAARWRICGLSWWFIPLSHMLLWIHWDHFQDLLVLRTDSTLLTWWFPEVISSVQALKRSNVRTL